MSPQWFGRSFRNLVRWCQMGLLTAPTVKTFEFQKSNMADGRCFENRQIAMSLQPFDQFWWNLTRWRILVPDSGLTVKTSNFWKSKMAAVAILKIIEIAISPQNFQNLVWWCKMALATTPTVKKLNFKNPTWRTAAILKTVKPTYICNRLTGFDEIWHNDAYWSPAPDVKFNFLVFDNLLWQSPYIKNRKAA